jgi:hypothetical protein
MNHFTRSILLLSCGVLLLSGCRRAGTLSPPDAAPDPLLGVKTAAAAEKPASPADAEGFHFPEDRGGQLLSKLLEPSTKEPRENAVSGPRMLSPSTAVEKPALPMPAGEPNAPRRPEPKHPAVAAPGPLAEAIPLVGHRGTPRPPEALNLAAGPLARLPLVDVNRPLPLPPLGQPVPDRAPLDDPTTDASQAAAFAAVMPERTSPSPFTRLALPDPFENRQTVQLRVPLLEDTMPSTAAPRLPKP